MMRITCPGCGAYYDGDRPMDYTPILFYLRPNQSCYRHCLNCNREWNVPDDPVEPALPKPPMNRLIRESEPGWRRPLCAKCGSSLYRTWRRWFIKGRQEDGCIQPECENYHSLKETEK